MNLSPRLALQFLLLIPCLFQWTRIIPIKHTAAEALPKEYCSTKIHNQDSSASRAAPWEKSERRREGPSTLPMSEHPRPQSRESLRYECIVLVVSKLEIA
ncbi:hypothetical protein GGR51DRAFT_510236 [Nemania sp. FL0031]|nr:hypothetical protein GGR51DRAFT_510236 [Nemania sp. FL0031]